ncbi:copper resistance protein B [Alkalimarinus coralli]|uniref:copper resistance protein B n=1 Tax=Alkalimarinus coralli TaxID=2935863 RepID=UPI00202B23A1|nr:copper resistance protein B [Alkalimarinus coralli]
MINVKTLFPLFFSLIVLPVIAGVKDDPVLAKMMVNQLEIRDIGDDNITVWDAQLWAGQDLQKLWLKSEGEYTNGATEESELQVLYSQAVAPYWDVQFGWRGDLKPSPDRHWLALGVQGLTPYYFEIDTALFVGNHGRVAARIEAEYELLFTQQLILSPELEMNFFSKDDVETETGSGLSDLEAGLRLRYEIRREIAPYIGVNWSRKVGKTADFARDEGNSVDITEILIGIRAWF